MTAITGEPDAPYTTIYSGADDIWYLTHDDGRVLAIAHERESSRTGIRWRACAWTADPRTTPDAQYELLCADATQEHLRQTIANWAQ